MKTKVTFDDWMSGRQWLGEKAPAEGFYGRYKSEEIAMMKQAFELGSDGYTIDDPTLKAMISTNQGYLVGWANKIGMNFNYEEQK